MFGMGMDWLVHRLKISDSNDYAVCPTASKSCPTGCLAEFDMLFLRMDFFYTHFPWHT